MEPTRDNQTVQAETIAQAIFEAMADPVFVIDFIGDDIGPAFRYVNEAACRLLHRGRAELLALRPGTIDDLSDEARSEAYERLVSEGRATFETLMIAADGRRIPMEIHASDAMLAGRRVCIAVARSLVARKEMDRRMLEAKEAAETANRAKSEFLATMSHEIRTPLHGVIGFASMLEDQSDLSSQTREAIEGIRDSANLLLALVTDVLDFSRIEAGQLELQPAPLDLASQLRRIASAFKHHAGRKGLDFNLQEDPALPAFILADSLRIEQVLGNLLGNALKFTEQGIITLTVGSRPLASGGLYEITFAIADTGIGIPAGQLSRLFHSFTQADSSPSRRHGGSGLGLAIVMRLCQIMGGSVAVQSEVGRGSVFTASIVAQEAVSASFTSPAAINLPAGDHSDALRILVAEDNLLNQKLMRRMIERLGYTADFAPDGSRAYEMAAREEGYDLIFMDVSMPGVSGLDATRTIRSLERRTERRPSWIVALTAGVSEGERRACTDSGMNDFLGKPFTEVGLRSALERARLHRQGP